MGFQDHTLSTILSRLATEFGDSSVKFSSEAKTKVNDALELLWQSRPFWNWSAHPIAFNLAAQITATATVTNSSAVVNFSSPIATDLKRWTAAFSNDSNSEYIIIEKNTTTQITLDAPYVGLSATVPCVLYNSFIELPEDFAKIISIKDNQNFYDKLIYQEPWMFEHHRTNRLWQDSIFYYTVLMDPVREDFNRQFFTFYPRNSNQLRLDGLYATVPPFLENGSDVPPVPRAYRNIIFYKAAHLLAIKLENYDKATFYDQQVQNSVKNFISAESFVDDDDTVLRGPDDPTGFPIIPDEVRV